MCMLNERSFFCLFFVLPYHEKIPVLWCVLLSRSKYRCILRYIYFYVQFVSCIRT